MKKIPFRLTPYQVQWLLIVGFLTVGYALYLRYLVIEFSPVALACDGGLQTMACNARSLAMVLFKNEVFGTVAMAIALLHVIRPSIVLLTGALIAAAEMRDPEALAESGRKGAVFNESRGGAERPGGGAARDRQGRAADPPGAAPR